MYRLEKNEMYKIASLFNDWEETLIWSCLQGYMGNAWSDEMDNPLSAQVITGDFCFFAGIPDVNLVRNIPADFPSKYILMVPQNEEWAKKIEEVYNDSCHKFMRYAIKKESDVFDEDRLRANRNKLPEGYVIKKIDHEIYDMILGENWSKDLCVQFPTYEMYSEKGLGFVVLYDGKVVSGASSYTVYDKGIEIEIDTNEEYRRKGLALAVASALILECQEKGLYPSWDAANLESVALSEKLGYHFDKEYVTYAVSVDATVQP